MELHNISRKDAKALVLRLCYGGAYKLTDANKEDYDPPQRMTELLEFKVELGNIMAEVCKLETALYEEVKNFVDKDNKPASVMSILAQQLENDCLMSMVDYYRNVKHLTVGVLCFDGLMLEKEGISSSDIPSLLRGCEKHVAKQTGWNISLEEKPFDSSLGFDIPTNTKTYEYMKVEHEKNHFKCTDSASYYEIKPDGRFIMGSEDFIIKQNRHIKFEEVDKTGKVEKKSFIEAWINDEDIRKYEKAELIPPPDSEKVDPNIYNLWDGFRIAKVEPKVSIDGKGGYTAAEKTGAKDILNHMEFICGRECWPWVEKWITLLLKAPSTKPDVAILIKSMEGLGKGFTYKILRAIIGKKYCMSSLNVERDIFGEFNIELHGKLLVLMDEMDMKTCVKCQRGILDIITGEDLCLNDKQVKKFNAVNYTHILTFSNKDVPDCS